MSVIQVEGKTCSKCGVLKPLSEFYRSTQYTLGVRCACKICEYEVTKEYRSKNRDKTRTRMRQYFLKNKDRINELSRRRLLESPKLLERKRERNREHYANNKDLYRIWHFLYDIKNGLLAHDGCCVFCGEINPFVLHNHHLFGRKKDKENEFIFTFCANHHELFRNFPGGPWTEGIT